VTCSVLAMIVVEVWLVYSGRHGIRTGTDQHELYEQLADQLIDNSFDSVGLRDRPSDLVTSGVTPRVEPVLHSRCKGNSHLLLLPR
jgi:hypothetical protein